MSTEPQNVGTPETAPVVSDAGTAAPVADDNAKAEKKPVPWELAEGWKEKAAKYNELERSGKLAALETPAPSPTSQPEGGAGTAIPGVSEERVRQAIFAMREGYATAEDLSIVSIASTIAQNEQTRRLAYENALSRIPEAERKGTEELYQTGEFRSLESARKAWKGSLSPAEYVALYGEKKPEPVISDTKRPEPVDTSTANLGPTGTMKRLSEQQLISEIRAAKEKGDTARLSQLTKMAREG